MKNMSTILFRTVLLAMIISLAGFAGCKSKPKDQPVPAPQQAAAPAVAQAPQPEEAKVEKEIYVYDSKNRRDPFLSLIVDLKEKPKGKKKANPIENFDVDEIKLIAIAWAKDSYYAMITLPDKKSYTIKKGMTLGLYGGRVEAITQNMVKISEQVRDYRGQTVTKDTILKLRQEGE